MKRSESTLQTVRNTHKSVILKAIRDAKEISRADITSVTGISSPTVTRIVNQLIAEGLVRNIGIGGSSGGRPPVILEFNAKSCYVIGIEWGLTQINGVIADLNGENLVSKSIEYELSSEFEIDLKLVIDLIHDLLAEGTLNRDMVKGIGIAVAGYVNKRTGTIEFSPVQKWHNIDVSKPIEKEFGIPVILDYLSRVATLGEYLYGVGRDINELLYISIDYGIGAGILHEGKVAQGYDGFTGEFGHIYITPPEGYQDRLCFCGKMNCLAEFVSGRGIARTAKRKIDRYPESLLLPMCDNKPERITAKMIAQAAKFGDEFARKILSEAGDMLGISIANISNILNPEAVIIGGKISKSDFFFSEVRKSFSAHGLRGVPREIRLLKSENIDDAVVKGSIALVLEGVLDYSIK